VLRAIDEPHVTIAGWDMITVHFCLVALAGAALAISGCADAAIVPAPDRLLIETKLEGSLRFLHQSMFAGSFYDDDRYRLLHPRRFEELTYLLDAEGQPIAPPAASEVVPVGTRVRIEEIEWATGDEIFRRPLYTPRYTTWVWLRVARDRGREASIERDERYILLLPGGITDAATFDQWLDASISAEDPNPWLLSLGDAERAAVLQKRAVVGMDYRTLTAAMGYPDRISRSETDGHTQERAAYGKQQVELVDGRVKSVDVLIDDSVGNHAL
jgi:hypothetical protein